MKAYVKIVDKINKIVGVIVVVFFVGAFLSTFLQVVMRNLTSISVPWTDELSRYLVIYIVYLAAGLAARSGRLIRMEVLPMLMKLSEKQIQVFYWIASFLTIVFSVIAVYSSISAIQMNMNKNVGISWIFNGSSLFCDSCRFHLVGNQYVRECI